jgi:UDP-glucose 4-epimerase
VRALVTGGAGFIGSALVDRLLAEGHAVDVIDDLSTGRLSNLADARADRSAELKIHQSDIRNPEITDLVARRQPNVVFHLAATRSDDPAVDATVNVIGALHVLEGARLAGTGKIVFAAGAELYGEPDPGALPLRESQPQSPASAHGVGQKAVIDYLRLYRERYGIEFTALALATVYGPRQFAPRGVVASFARALLDGIAPEIRGDGAQTRDFLFVDDAVDAIVRSAERGSGLIVNVGRGVETSVSALLALMVEALGRPSVPPRAVTREPGDLDRVALDPGRARMQLGWEPWTSLEEGVSQVLRWSVANPA